VDLLQAESLAHGLQLLEEGLDHPERRVVRPRRVAAAELVVEDDPPSLLRQRPEAEQR
jgi:hypothetical protein